jgi:hypothetical protein
MNTKKKFSPKNTHYVTFDEAAAVPSTITLYGKLIADGESQPSTLGLSHPSNATESLHRSLVFGACRGSQCQKLPQPQQVWLPAPDGPADGCGWDGSQYVVWKNLPADWMTLHVVTERKTLSAALALGNSTAALATMATGTTARAVDWDDRVIAVVQEWAHPKAQISGDDVLSTLWQVSVGTSFSLGAQSLSQLIQKRLGMTVSKSAITDKLTVDGLIQLIV